MELFYEQEVVEDFLAITSSELSSLIEAGVLFGMWMPSLQQFALPEVQFTREDFNSEAVCFCNSLHEAGYDHANAIAWAQNTHEILGVSPFAYFRDNGFDEKLKLIIAVQGTITALEEETHD